MRKEKIIIGSIKILAHFPFCLLYLFSDLAYYVVYYIMRYRRNVVRINLTNAFPDKTKKEILKIEHKFYHFLCDYSIETIKLLTMSEKEMKHRMRFEGVSETEAILEKKQLAFVYLGHYCNWEWVSSLALWFEKEDTIAAQIYRPLKSEMMDKLFYGLRTRFKAENISKYDTLRRIVTMKKNGQKAIIGFISDQAPGWPSIHDWVNFLNQDTPVFTGTERIAKKLDTAVYYARVTREKRGHYVCRFIEMEKDVKGIPDYQLTERYMQMLEEDILRHPELWLWSHKRWKRQRNADGSPRPDIVY